MALPQLRHSPSPAYPSPQPKLCASPAVSAWQQLREECEVAPDVGSRLGWRARELSDSSSAMFCQCCRAAVRHFLGIWPLGQGSGKGSAQGVAEASLISTIDSQKLPNNHRVQAPGWVRYS